MNINENSNENSIITPAPVAPTRTRELTDLERKIFAKI